MKLKIFFSYLIILTFFSTSCKKKNVHPVPSIPFDITININLPTYSDLLGVGGYAYASGGSKGIVIYRVNTYDFIAFDRHSPANDGECNEPLITNTDNFLQLDDQCTGAKFNLIDGSPISGSKFGLRAYTTVFDGNSNLRIYN